jgi:hypothetical protein
MDLVTIFCLPVEMLQMIFVLSGEVSLYPLKFTCHQFWEIIGLRNVPCYASKVAKTGNLPLLQWACDQGVRIDGMLGTAAIIGGNLRMVEWLDNKGICKFGEWSWEAAAVHGHMHILEWLRTASQIYDVKTPVYAAKHGHLEVIKWWKHRLGKSLHATIGDAAASGGHLHILKWLLREGNIAPRPQAYSEAVRSGYLDVMKWLHKQKVPIYESIAISAAAWGHLHILKWLYNIPIVLPITDIRRVAIKRGRVHILEWLNKVRY